MCTCRKVTYWDILGLHIKTDIQKYLVCFRCWSSIGRRGGAQVLSVGKRCGQIGIMIHEIGHALGLWHEHSRPDRNEYITIRWDNIEPLRYKNFARSSVDAIDSLGTPYDIGSIMHYGATSFGRRDPHTGLKRTTIELVDKDRQPGVKMGQRLALSSTDIQQMNLLYRCSKTGKYCSTLSTFISCFFTPNL